MRLQRSKKDSVSNGSILLELKIISYQKPRVFCPCEIIHGGGDVALGGGEAKRGRSGARRDEFYRGEGKRKGRSNCALRECRSSIKLLPDSCERMVGRSIRVSQRWRIGDDDDSIGCEWRRRAGELEEAGTGARRTSSDALLTPVAGELQRMDRGLLAHF